MKHYHLPFTALMLMISMTGHTEQEDLHSLQKQHHDWMIVKQDNTRNIVTYAKNEEGQPIRSFKIEATVDASLDTLAKIHFDINNMKKWYWEALDSKLLTKISDTEYVYYMRFQAPLAPDRDAVIHAQIEPFEAGVHPYMLLTLRATPTALPESPGMVRISAFDIDIKFTPLAINKTRIEIQGLINPSGNLPVWVSNMFQRQAPYATMLGLYRMTQKTEYLHPKSTSFVFSR